MNDRNDFKIAVEIDDLRIHINLYGGFFYHENAFSPTHSHNRYEFHLMMEGESTLFTESKIVVLRKAEACVVAPSIIHTCTPSASKNSKATFCFSFEKIGKKSKKNLYEKFESIFNKIDEISKIENAEQYISDLNQILSTFYSQKRFAKTRLKMLLSLFILSIVDDLSTSNDESEEYFGGENFSSGAEKNLRCIMIEDYINQNYNREINLNDLSNILFLSKKQTERIFKKEIGMSFKEFVLKIRLKDAMRYLENTDMTVSDIAYKVGYKSYNGFYRVFLENVGMTPKEYRKVKKVNNS